MTYNPLFGNLKMNTMNETCLFIRDEERKKDKRFCFLPLFLSSFFDAVSLPLQQCYSLSRIKRSFL